MDWILGGVLTVALLAVPGYAINSLLQSRRVTVFPLLRVEREKRTPQTASRQARGPNAGQPDGRGGLGLVEEEGGEMVSVEQIMKKGPLKTHSWESVKTAATMMAQHCVGSLLVEDGEGEVQGIVTETEFVRKVIAPGLTPATMTVAQVMSSPVIYIDRKQTVADAYELMDRYQIWHLAVTENRRIVGILSFRDLLHPIHQEHGA